MSFDAMLWANKDAPVADVQERAVLGVMSEPASEDGSGSCLAVKTIAARCRLSEREVRACQKAMLDRGLVALGDQSVALRYHRADRTPTVYDLMIPYSMFANIKRANEWRANHGLEPITRENRPDIPDPPPRKRRADLGTKRAKAASSSAHGVTGSPGGLQEPSGRTTRTSAPYIEPVVEPLLLVPTHPEDRVVVEDPNPVALRASAILATIQQASGLPSGRVVRGEPLAKLTDLLAARLATGWSDQQATDALSGPFNGGPVFGALRYRINNNLAGPPPSPQLASIPHARFAARWCGRCADATRRRWIDPDTGAATSKPCPTCAASTVPSR